MVSKYFEGIEIWIDDCINFVCLKQEQLEMSFEMDGSTTIFLQLDLAATTEVDAV